MSLIAAGIAAGAGLIKNRRSTKAGDAAADDASANTELAMGELQKGVNKLDDLQPMIDRFAQQGQDSFDKYQNMLGPLEESLNDYYTNLNPDELAAQGNQTAQQQYQNSMNQVNDQLAAQGITNSGMGSQLGMEYGNQMAQTKAQNIMDAPHQVAQQQQGWLNYGAQQSNNAFGQMQAGLGAQTNQANAYNQAYGNMANMYGGQAAQSHQTAQDNYSQGSQALNSGMMLGGYLGDKAGWKF